MKKVYNRTEDNGDSERMKNKNTNNERSLRFYLFCRAYAFELTCQKSPCADSRSFADAS